MEDDGPKILRPVPRRPFNLSIITPSRSEDGSSPPSPSAEDQTASLLKAASQIAEQPSISRLHSFRDLTAPTLLGIYSPSTSASDKPFFESDTPWGTGTQTPIKRPSVDNDTYELMRDRSHIVRRRSSIRTESFSKKSSSGTTTTSRTLSSGLLFVLGVGYGALVTKFHNERGIGGMLSEGIIIKPGLDWRYLTFWGIAGVILGALLPWFDRVWEETFEENSDEAIDEKEPAPEKETDPGTDMALVVRAIGAFIGIAFAIRKLAWDSTMQASATLALVNPLLWWIFDRSMPGFVLSTAVGITGSLFLLGVNPEMMPAPSTSPFRNSSMRTGAGSDADVDLLTLGGYARQETVEAGIWMLSVLFCSCVCFGNIGRKLMQSQTAGRRRWMAP